MSAYCFLLVIAIILAGAAGCKAAGNDLLQQVFSARKFSRRLAEFLCAAMVLFVIWIQIPAAWLRFVPGMVCVLYWIVCGVLHLVFKRKEAKQGEEEQRREIRESALCTVTGMSIAIGAALLLCMLLAHSPQTASRLGATEVDRCLCHGLALGVLSLLLAGLAHYLVFLRLYPGEEDNPNRDLLRLRKKLRTSHRI